MIEWKIFDRSEPPIFEKMFLIKHDGGVTSGFLDKADNGRLGWVTYNSAWLLSVTHYAELNLPLKEPNRDE